MAESKIKITAETGEAESKLKTLGETVKEMDEKFIGLGETMGTLGAALTSVSLVELVKGAMESADQMGKMAQKAGVSVESLSRLSVAAKLSDVNTQTLASAMGKLDKNMLAAQAGTGASADAFKALGISVTDSSGKLKDSDEVMSEMAGKFSQYQDGAGKTAAAIAIFGKAGADMIPMLNDGSEEMQKNAELADKLGITLSGSVAKSAQEVNDRFTTMTLAGKGITNQVMSDMLPTFDSLSSVLVDTATDTDTLHAASDSLSTVLKGTVSIAMGAANQFEWMGRTLGGLAAVGTALAHGSLSEAKNILAEMGKETDAADQKFTEKMNKLWSATAPTHAAAAEGESHASRGQLNYKPGSAKAKKPDAYAALSESMDKMTASLAEELSGTEKLTAAQRSYAETNAMIADGKLKLTAAEKAEFEARSQGILALDKEVTVRQQAKVALAEQASVMANLKGNFDRQIAAQQSAMEVMSISDRARAAALDKISSSENKARDIAGKGYAEGRTNAEQYMKTLQLISDEAERQVKATNAVQDAQDKLNGSWQYGAAKATQQYLDNVGMVADKTQKLFGDAFKGMDDALTNFVKTGKLNFSSLADSIITDLIHIQVEENIVGPMAKALKSAGGFSGLISGLVHANGNGNAFDGGVQAYANGGAFTNSIVDTPTAFKFANGGGFNLGVMGEAGPEAIMPLKRGPDGRLGVATATAPQSASGGITINIAVDASGNSRTDSANGGANNKHLQTMASRLADITRNTLVNEMRPGGILAQAGVHAA